jgi:hypothetical protein
VSIKRKFPVGTYVQELIITLSSSIMSVLKDVAVDILNNAKLSKDATSKLFELEQIREILLHRQTDLIPELISDVFDFVLDKASKIRKFLIKFSVELFELNPALTAPHLIILYNLYLTESNDSVLAVLCKEMSRIYGKLFLHLSSSQSNQNSQPHFQQFIAIITKLIEYVASARSENVKIHGLYLIEAMVLFGLPNTVVSSDPRLARKINDPRLRRAAAGSAANTTTTTSSMTETASGTAAGGSAGSGSSNTVEEIPLHHPFINKDTVQREAEDWFNKLNLWSNKNGPQNYPFSARIMAVLGQVISSVGAQRSNHALNAVKAVTWIINGKTNLAAQMTANDKERIARAATRLIRAVSIAHSSSEAQDLLQKLRAAVQSLDVTTVIDSETAGTLAGKKREMADLYDEEELMLEEETHQSSVRNALTSAESSKKQMLQRSTAMNENLFLSATTTSTTSVAGSAGTSSSGSAGSGNNRLEARQRHTVTIAECTELSADIVALQNLTLNIQSRLVNIESSSKLGDTIMEPASVVDGREYSDLAHFNLLRIMDSYQVLRDLKNRVTRATTELLLRTVLSLALASIKASTSPFMVPVILSWGKDAPSEFTNQFPTAVYLPR